MKQIFARTARTRFTTVASAFTCLIAIATSAGAEQLKEARVTQVVNDVKLLAQQAAPRPAAVSDLVRTGTAVRTGTQSRSELTFADLTITRLGANTIFSFNEGTRVMNLSNGAILFQVPKGSGGLTIKTAAVTAGITGTTGIGEFHPATTSNALPFSKWLCLEGTFHLILPNGQSVDVGPGKMVTTDGKSFSKVVSFDIGQLVKTSLFFTGFDKPLASLDLIVLEEQKQLALQLASGLVNTTTQNPLDLIIDIIDQGIVAQGSIQPPPAPPPTPSKFGTPSVISSPVPYVITSGTTITTDPTITTNGVTDFGKIWRGTSIDGPLSAFIFGSTSAFDTAIGLDAGAEKFADSGAVFKFTSLELTGNPTVSTTNGQTALALVGVNGITSGGPGGTLTFAGISTLLLATQDGSINLGSEISFSGFQHLVFYARGAGSNLTLASPVSATIQLDLFAEGNIQISSVDASLTAERVELLAGDSITLDGGVMSATATNSTGNVDISAGNGISITNGLEIDRIFGGQSSGLNVSLTAGTDLTAGNSLVVNVDNSVTGNLNDGANITFDIGGNLTINGGGALSLTVDNSGGGHIGTGGNISVTTGGDLTSGGGINLTIRNNTIGTIDNGGNITVTTAGDLTASSVSALVNNFDGGKLGANGSVDFEIGGNLAAQGDIDLEISNNTSSNANIGGTIGGAATVTAHIAGDLTAQGAAIFAVSNNGSGSPTTNGGTINSNAAVNFTAGNVSVVPGGSLGFNGFFAEVFNGEGLIGGNATVTVNAGNFTVADSFGVDVDNDNGSRLTGDATVNLNASSITLTRSNPSFSNFLFSDISNEGSSIGGNAALNITVSNAMTADGAEIDIINNFDDEIPANGGGHIAGSATLNMTAGSLSIGGGGLFIDIDNTGGTIGGSAVINFAAGNINTQGDALFLILNSDNGIGGGPGSIGLNATINITSGGDFTANSLTGFINDRHGGFIGGAATLGLSVGGALTISNDVSMGISTRNDGTGGGTIGSNATVDISAASVSVGGGFTTFVSTAGGGSITGNASNTLNVTGNLVVQGPILAEIVDPGFNQINPINFIAGGHIGGDATVTLSAQNITTSSTASGIPGQDIMALEASIYPNGSGTIGGNATVNVLASQNITAPGTTFFTVANGNFMGTGGGTIGGNATLNISAVNLTTGTLFADIYNYGGASIGGSANINFNLTGNLTTQSDANFLIDNSNGGTIGGNATINMNVSGSAAVTSNATFQILGSDGATSAAINFNGGSYGAGGTFLSSIDGNGTITFNNASVHANVLQVGALGTNGVLNIGGGTLSADTTLKLYAPGSNGQLNFISNVTLGGNSAKILAADSVTIFNNVVVTIGGSNPADVYTGFIGEVPKANYTGSGGNGSTTGTFAGAGANSPQPLSSAPPFNDPPLSAATVTSVTSGGNVTSGKKTGAVMNVSDSGQLLSLLDAAVPGPGGKITIPASKSTSNWRDSSGINAAGGLNSGRRAADIRDAHSLPARRLP